MYRNEFLRFMYINHKDDLKKQFYELLEEVLDSTCLLHVCGCDGYDYSGELISNERNDTNRTLLPTLFHNDIGFMLNKTYISGWTPTYTSRYGKHYTTNAEYISHELSEGLCEYISEWIEENAEELLEKHRYDDLEELKDDLFCNSIVVYEYDLNVFQALCPEEYDLISDMDIYIHFNEDVIFPEYEEKR